jgi:outer membrane protein
MKRFGVGMLVLVMAGPALGWGPGVTAQQALPLKIGVVDMRSVLQQTPGYAKAESTWARELDGYRAEVSKMQDSLAAADSMFEKSSALLSPTARAAKRRDLEAQRDRVEKRTNELREKAGNREAELLEPIQRKVNAAIDSVRAEDKYLLILDASAQGGSVLFADKTLDITGKVIQRLQASP